MDCQLCPHSCESLAHQLSSQLAGRQILSFWGEWITHRCLEEEKCLCPLASSSKSTSYTQAQKDLESLPSLSSYHSAYFWTTSLFILKWKINYLRWNSLALEQMVAYTSNMKETQYTWIFESQSFLRATFCSRKPRPIFSTRSIPNIELMFAHEYSYVLSLPYSSSTSFFYATTVCMPELTSDINAKGSFWLAGMWFCRNMPLRSFLFVYFLLVDIYSSALP